MKENVQSIWVPESWGRESFSSLGAIRRSQKMSSSGLRLLIFTEGRLQQLPWGEPL